MTDEKVDLNKFINITEATNDKPSNILVHIKHYRTQKEHDYIIKHAVTEVTKGLLSSQSKGMDFFNVCTIFPEKFEKKNMDMKLVVNLARTMMTLFPHNLLKYYVYNPPKLFSIFWSVLKTVLDKDLRQKVVVVKKDNTQITDLDNLDDFDI
jgi:hypothetical protein